MHTCIAVIAVPRLSCHIREYCIAKALLVARHAKAIAIRILEVIPTPDCPFLVRLSVAIIVNPVANLLLVWVYVCVFVIAIPRQQGGIWRVRGTKASWIARTISVPIFVLVILHATCNPFRVCRPIAIIVNPIALFFRWLLSLADPLPALAHLWSFANKRSKLLLTLPWLDAIVRLSIAVFVFPVTFLWSWHLCTARRKPFLGADSLTNALAISIFPVTCSPEAILNKIRGAFAFPTGWHALHEFLTP
jgi:hypothetical protein